MEHPLLLAATWLAAMLCASIMGYAIQRGGTCTVAAMEELLLQRRATRLGAMLEASLWVAGGLLLAQTFGALASLPAGKALTRWTVLGAALLGLGALINKACVFGTVARWGKGEWAYLATGLGFYLGGWLAHQALRLDAPAPGAAAVSMSLLSAAPSVALLLLAAYAVWRLRGRLPARRNAAGQVSRPDPGLPTKGWTPHAATAVIGITFVAMWLLVGGAWAYTDVLADWSRGMHHPELMRAALLLCVLGGALWGGRHQVRLHNGLGAPLTWLRCLIGGTLMGMGSLLIPGSNDGLILLGMPLLLPHAWLAFAVMGASIALGMGLQRGWQPQR